MSQAIKSLSYGEYDVKNDPYIKKSQGFEVYWSHVKYRVYRGVIDIAVSKFSGQDVNPSRMVLKDVSGSFKSGEMTALMGPSGAGKTSLMETLIGKRVTGLSGEIKCKSGKKIRMALIPQYETLFEELRVDESLVISSKLKNGSSEPASFHNRKVNEIITQMDLTRVAKNNIKSLSGSEKKRLSIGMDLISSPDLLFLDEPTTGLDSFTAKTIIEHLAVVAKRENMAVVMTIHQPSWTLFEHFSKVIMLSPITGTCLYEGQPNDVVPVVSNLGVDCPENVTPCDFLTDVAFGLYGKDIVYKLAEEHLAQTSQNEKYMTANNYQSQSVDLQDAIKRNPKDMNFFMTFWLILYRFHLTIVRDPSEIVMQIVPPSMIALSIFLAYGSEVGSTGMGCPLTPDHPMLQRNFTSHLYLKMFRRYNDEISEAWKNLSMMFISLMTAVVTCVLQPIPINCREVKIVMREIINRWYNSSTYFAAKTIFDTALMVVPYTIFVTITYGLTQDDFGEFWRYAVYLGAYLMTSLGCQALAIIVGFILRDYPAAAVFIAPFPLFPSHLASGFPVARRIMDEYLNNFRYFYTLPWSMDSMVIAVFGYDRCGFNLKEGVIKTITLVTGGVQHIMGIDSNVDYGSSLHNSTSFRSIDRFSHLLAGDVTRKFITPDADVRPSPMAYLDIMETDLGRSVAWLVLNYFCLRVAAYITVVWVVNARV